MPFTYPSLPDAADPDILKDGARAKLLANSAVAGIVGTRIFPDIAPQGTASPWVILSLPSTVYAGGYQEPILNSLMDISCYAVEYSTTTVRALLKACIGALVDSSWTVADAVLLTANIQLDGTGWRTIDNVTAGVVTRGRQATIRIWALRTA